MISDRSFPTITNSKPLIPTEFPIGLFVMLFGDLLLFERHGINVRISILVLRDILAIVENSLILDAVSIDHVRMFIVRIILFEI
jgi:hypothetical protein